MNFPLFVDLGGGGYMFIKIKVSTFPTDNFNGSLTLTLISFKDTLKWIPLFYYLSEYFRREF